MKSWNRADWLILLLFAILVALFTWRLWTPSLADRQSYLPGDFALQFWAFSTFEVRELSAGRLPLWNPYTFAGTPFWADVQSAVFYPPSLLTLLLSAPWGFSLFALQLEAIAHFWLAATFMYLFIRELTQNRSAALIAALTFTFSGYLTGYPSQQLAVLEADVWLPLLLYFLHKAYLGDQRFEANRTALPPLTPPARGRTKQTSPLAGVNEGGRALQQPISSTSPQNTTPHPPHSQFTIFYLLLAAIAWSLTLLAGHPQSALIVAYISTVYLIFLHFTTHRNTQYTIRNTLLLARSWSLIFLTGIGLAAIQFIPAAEYTLLSVRAEGTYDNMSNGFPLIDVIQFLLPSQISLYSPLYIGVAGLILAIWVVLSQPNRFVIFWAIVAALSLLITFGGNTFLYSPLYLTIPGFSIFRGQERWAFATAFSLCVLVGYGFHALQAAMPQGNKIAVSQGNKETKSTTHNAQRTTSTHISSITLYLFFTALLFTFLCFYGLNDTGWTPNSPFFGLLEAATLLTLLLGLTWLLWKLAPFTPPIILTTLTAALICFDLFTINWQTNLYPQPPEWHTQVPSVVAALKEDAAKTPDEPYRVYNEYRVRDHSGQFTYDNYGIPFEIEDLWGASPLRPARYDQFLAPPMPIERTWELLNVKYVITWREELYVPSTIIYEEPTATDTTYVHRLDEIGPRAWLVSQIQTTDDSTILQTLADPTFDRWNIALLEPSSINELPVQETDINTSQFTIHNSQFTPSKLSYQLTTPAPTLLILSEPHYPGWHATINGQSAPILRANYILRAVPVPAGGHTVELTFRPLSFTVGAIVSGVTLVIVVFFLIRGQYTNSRRNIGFS